MQGDLTEMDVDAIVNAATMTCSLARASRAIRRKGGETIQQECDAIGSIPIGGAAITSGGKLRARFVIHAASMQLEEKRRSARCRILPRIACESPPNGNSGHRISRRRLPALPASRFPTAPDHALGSGRSSEGPRRSKEFILSC